MCVLGAYVAETCALNTKAHFFPLVMTDKEEIHATGLTYPRGVQRSNADLLLGDITQHSERNKPSIS